ncbi:putative leader peptide [Frankia sp. CiP3]
MTIFVDLLTVSGMCGHIFLVGRAHVDLRRVASALCSSA